MWAFQLCSIFSLGFGGLLISIWILRSACPFLKKRAAGVLMGVALNQWVSLGSTVILILFFQSMNTGYLYAYLHLELLSTLSFSFQCTSTAFPWLILLLILFFWCHCKWTSFPNFTFRLSITSIEKYLFLYIDIISCNTATCSLIMILLYIYMGAL